MDKRSATWPLLANPPVAMALFQLKFDPAVLKLEGFNSYDAVIKNILPNRRDNLQIGLDLKGEKIHLGKSTITGQSDTRLKGSVYFSDDQKVKLELSDGTITYIDERKYISWDNFQQGALRIVSLMKELLGNLEVVRTSIRFINRFSVTEFNAPEDYFNILISGKEETSLPYPLRQYSYRLTIDVPDTEIYSIVNHSIENVRPDLFSFTLDIDVLDCQRIFFAEKTLVDVMDGLREVKNTIFFKMLTQKSLDLCN